MRRDLVIGTVAGITIGIIAYITSRPGPPPKRPAPIEIDPAVYRLPNPTYKHPSKPVFEHILTAPSEKSGYKAPYEVFGFGLDVERNMDSIDPDSYLNMPLESDGITYKTRDKYTSLEETEDVVEKKYKYIRFTVLEVRGEGSTARIGGIRFLRRGEPIPNMHIWNPHTGEKTVYDGKAWTDSDQWTVVFVFSEPALIDSYQIKTSMESEESDPATWKLEASHNASFWSEIHTITSGLSPRRDAVRDFRI